MAVREGPVGQSDVTTISIANALVEPPKVTVAVISYFEPADKEADKAVPADLSFMVMTKLPEGAD